MKKLLALATMMILGTTLSFAQGTTGTTHDSESGKKTTKTSKAHKGGKKSKKGSSDGTTTPAPK